MARKLFPIVSSKFRHPDDPKAKLHAELTRSEESKYLVFEVQTYGKFVVRKCVAKSYNAGRAFDKFLAATGAISLL